MEFNYYRVSDILAETEREEKGDFYECLETYETTGFSHRWIQPPVVCYFVTTVDRFGNSNTTAVSMGTAFQAMPPHMRWCYAFAMANDRQGRRNLDETGECVISYFPYSLIRQSEVAGLPVPDGISEMEVAGLTPLPSKQVKPCGIAECVSNLEAKVIETVRINGSTLFVLEIVGCSVHKDAVEKDMRTPYEPGMLMSDLLFEVSIKPDPVTGDPARLNYARLNPEVYPTPNDFGPDNRWVGTFEEWMDGEERRGKITSEEKQHILQLNSLWLTNRDPDTNGEVKKELTDWLKKIVNC